MFADRIPYCSKCEGVVKPGEFANTSQVGGIKAQFIVTLIPQNVLSTIIGQVTFDLSEFTVNAMRAVSGHCSLLVQSPDT